MKLNPNIKLFDNNIPILVDSYINNNIEDIHKELFDKAINKYCEDNSIDISQYKVIDIKNEDNWLMPSNFILLHKHEFTKIKGSLKDYWNVNYLEENQKSIFTDLLIDDENKKDIEIEYIDYVKGKVKFRNKYTNKEFFIDFTRINNNLQYKKQLSNTFTSLLRDGRTEL